jgi:FlaA1/EpsC-like NDP-sugar epimerase
MGTMKYFVNTVTTPLVSRELLMNRAVSRFLHRHGLLIILCMFAMLIGFNAAVAIQMFSDVLILPMDAILCSSLLSFVFVSRIKGVPPVACVSNPREIDVLDLLGREIVPIEITKACAFLKGRVILVTGAAGSIGSELCRQLLDCEPGQLIALDSNETGLFDLFEGLRSRSHPRISCLHPFIGDITDEQRMVRLFAEKRPDIVFHAAAYKHVPLLEHYPDLAIRTNALATYHLCSLAQEYNVARFVFISTDKAAEPISIMGASKRLGEMVVQSLASSTDGLTRFCAVRFGNVIGSRGSVVPVFTRQIEQGGPLTVTDPEATRYFMTIPEACGLVILASAIADQGGLYLLNMGEPVRILDLAVKMISLCGLRAGHDIPIVYTGLRPGERAHETLVAADEELTPTTHSKILCVAQRAALPTAETVVQWMSTLEESLQYKNSTELREHLFEIVGEKKLLVTS